MNHFLLVKSNGVTRDGSPISARDSANLLLEHGVWPLWKHTRNRHAVQAGDRVAVYCTGIQCVIATANVCDVVSWSRRMQAQYPLFLDGEPFRALLLDHIMHLDPVVPIKACLGRLSFFNNTPKWGVALMGGMRALTPADFEVLTDREQILG